MSRLIRFAIQGNVFELAIGIIVGSAFSDVVKSLVDDILTPPFGLLLGGVDFSDLVISMMNFIYQDEPPVVIRYGKFLQRLINLLIIAFVLFFVIKAINRVKRLVEQKQIEEENNRKKELSDEVKLLAEIRNILAWKSSIYEEVCL